MFNSMELSDPITIKQVETVCEENITSKNFVDDLTTPVVTENVNVEPSHQLKVEIGDSEIKVEPPISGIQLIQAIKNKFNRIRQCETVVNGDSAPVVPMPRVDVETVFIESSGPLLDKFDCAATDDTDLKRRMKSHSEEKRHKCPVCKNTFQDASTLKRHVRFHEEERPFRCTMCDYTGTKATNLRRHFIRIHTDPGEKPKLKRQKCWHTDAEKP